MDPETHRLLLQRRRVEALQAARHRPVVGPVARRTGRRRLAHVLDLARGIGRSRPTAGVR